MSKIVKVSKIKIGVYGDEKVRNPKGESLAKEYILKATAKYLPGINIAVDINMVGKEKIREINNSQRNKDVVTDVLSFPMIDMHEGVYGGDISKEIRGGYLMLGDIVMCYDKIKEQAEEFGHSEERECAYLALHSILHLLGFDHVDEGRMKKNMRKAEEDILKNIL